MWLGGAEPSLADRDAFNEMSSAPSPDKAPATFNWWMLVSRFADAVRDSWPAGGKTQAKPEQAPKKDKK